MRFFGATVVVAWISAMMIASPAAALEPGVTVDPSTPAGKEYSFPLDVQRAKAVGNSAPPGVPQKPFGVGIGPATVGTRTSRATATAAASRRTSSTPRRGSQRARGRRTGSAGPPASGAVPSPGGSARGARTTALLGLSRPRGTTFQIAAIVVPLVLAGLLAGVTIAIARTRRP